MKKLDNVVCIVYYMGRLYNKSVNAKNKSDHNNHTLTPITLYNNYIIYTHIQFAPGKKLTSASIDTDIFAYRG